jgi:hypothetical protein
MSGFVCQLSVTWLTPLLAGSPRWSTSSMPLRRSTSPFPPTRCRPLLQFSSVGVVVNISQLTPPLYLQLIRDERDMVWFLPWLF